MPAAIVWIFLVAASVFASVHNFAVAASLYWYYSWFDVVMHFWGGFLIVLGVFAGCSFSYIPFRPTRFVLIAVLLVTMVLWELFEIAVGLYNPTTMVYDISKDILFGSLGGLVGYLLMIRLRM